MALIAVLLAVATLARTMTPWLLLVLTLALSMGDAIESPTWRAIFPDLVPRSDLAPALALNGIEFNLARAIGPGLAGLVIAAAGVGVAFVLNAVSFLGVIFVIARWKHPLKTRRLPPETISGANFAAIRYVRYSPRIRTLLVRSGCVIFCTRAFWALLPSIARSLNKGPIGYGLVLAFFGVAAAYDLAVLVGTKNPREALALCQKAAKLNPGNPKCRSAAQYYQKQVSASGKS